MEQLLVRLEQGGPSPHRAAEELDRQAGRLRQTPRWPELEARVGALCDRWAAGDLRGERAQAWLTLVGAFGLGEQGVEVALLLKDPATPVSTRVLAARVLGQLRPGNAARDLLIVLSAAGEPRVRVAAAEALGEVRDGACRAHLEPLLEEDLPAPVWNAVAAALERL